MPGLAQELAAFRQELFRLLVEGLAGRLPLLWLLGGLGRGRLLLLLRRAGVLHLLLLRRLLLRVLLV